MIQHRPLALLLLALALPAGCSDEPPVAASETAVVEEGAEERLLSQAKELAAKMAAGDARYVVDSMPADFVARSGGRQATLRAMRAAAPMTRDLMANAVLGEPTPIRTVGKQLVAVVPYESEITVRGERRPMSACWIAFSRDRGATWSFVSGSKAARDFVAANRPKVYAAIEEDLQPVTVPGVGSR